jgi:hypothetical protein
VFFRNDWGEEAKADAVRWFQTNVAEEGGAFAAAYAPATCCMKRTEVIIKENTSFNEGDLNLEDYQGNADKKR